MIDFESTSLPVGPVVTIKESQRRSTEENPHAETPKSDRLGQFTPSAGSSDNGELRPAPSLFSSIVLVSNETCRTAELRGPPDQSLMLPSAINPGKEEGNFTLL